MRVSSKMEYSDFMRNLQLSTSKVQQTMNQLSSLKEVSKSSDNPLLVAKILDLNVSVAQNKTYGQTISDSTQWSQTQDSALDSVSTLMLNIRNLIEASANSGTVTQETLDANRKEISQSIAGVVDALNTNYDGRYIFGGTKTQEPPFRVIKDSQGQVTSFEYQGNADDLQREISNGVTLDLATDGSRFMNATGSSGLDENEPAELTQFFNGLIDTLKSGDPDRELSSKYLEGIDKFTDNFTDYRSKIGSIENRLSSASARNSAEKNTLAETLSNKQDVDVAEKFMEYQNQMVAYQSTLSMGTRIMQTTILDYIR